jgi:hypothetical protein
LNGIGIVGILLLTGIGVGNHLWSDADHQPGTW